MPHHRTVSAKPSRHIQDKGHVITLRARGAASGQTLGPRKRYAPGGGALLEDMDKYEHLPDGDEDYRDRMRVNYLAAIFTIMLMTAGVWLVNELAADGQSCYRPGGGCAALGTPAGSPVSAP
jgi:hypothetical protein